MTTWLQFIKTIPGLAKAITELIGDVSRVGSSVAKLASMPEWAGGIPKDAPPRPGTPEYDEWQKKRAQGAVTPKASKDR